MKDRTPTNLLAMRSCFNQNLLGNKILSFIWNANRVLQTDKNLRSCKTSVLSTFFSVEAYNFSN